MKTNSILNKFSPKGIALSQPKGFTLIELLIVIAILGVLAAGILVAINPLDKINAANDSRVQNDLGSMGRAATAYSATHSGFYPAVLNDLVTSGEIKSVPQAPSGYTYTVVNFPDPCTAGVTCTNIVITSDLKSTKYAATPFWRFESSTGRNCAVLTAATACP